MHEWTELCTDTFGYHATLVLDDGQLQIRCERDEDLGEIFYHLDRQYDDGRETSVSYLQSERALSVTGEPPFAEHAMWMDHNDRLFKSNLPDRVKATLVYLLMRVDLMIKSESGPIRQAPINSHADRRYEAVIWGQLPGGASYGRMRHRGPQSGSHLTGGHSHALVGPGYVVDMLIGQREDHLEWSRWKTGHTWLPRGADGDAGVSSMINAVCTTPPDQLDPHSYVDEGHRLVHRIKTIDGCKLEVVAEYDDEKSVVMSMHPFLEPEFTVPQEPSDIIQEVDDSLPLRKLVLVAVGAAVVILTFIFFVSL